jgi:hypothetical protein
VTLGSFSAADLDFEVDDGLTLVSMTDGFEIDEQALDDRFAGVGAPIASWILARLLKLSGGSLDLSADQIEVCEGGVFVIDFVVRSAGHPLGKVQLQAGIIGAAMLGVVAQDARDVVDRFVARMLEAPNDVATCRVRVRDPAWPTDHIVEFGFDGARYL